MHSTLTYFSFFLFSAAKVHHFCESCKYFARKFAFPLTFFISHTVCDIIYLCEKLTIPLLADFIAVHLVDQDLRQRCDGLEGNLPARIVGIRDEGR